ncbi:MAG: amino acid ABC transporter substrate-binding protein [Spirochaetes bacterium]|nr:amino acid ABC transporter substrate-binding protein [Spirochaetota bacterium]
MLKQSYKIIFTAVVAVMLLLQAVYGQQNAPKTIKIGAMYDITGPLATSGERFGWGLHKAVDKINKNGGIFIKEYNKKIPIELVEADHQAKEDRAVTQAEFLNDQGVVALIGTTSVLPTAASVYEKNHLPTLASVSSMDAPFIMGYKYIFSNFTKFSDIGKSGAVFFKSLSPKPSKVALFEVQYDPGIEACKYAEQEMKAAGIDTVRVKFTWLTKDMSSAILEAKKAGADAVYSFAILPDAMLMIKQMKELDFNPKAVLISEGPTNRGPWKSLRKDGDFVYTFNGFHSSLKYPGVKEIVAMYKAEKKEEPYETVGCGWSSVQIVADAITRAGSLDRNKIRDAMATTNMMTVTGPVKFRPNGTMDIKYASIVQIQNGVEVLVFPNNLKQKKAVYPAPLWKQR